MLHALTFPVTTRDHAQALDDVGDIDADANDVEHERCTVEEDVCFRGLEELDKEAQEADGGDDVQQAGDERRRLVKKAQVGFQLVVVGIGYRIGSPEEREVVGKGGEENAEKEAHGCDVLAGSRNEGRVGSEDRLTPDDEESRKGAGSAVVLGPGGLAWCYPRHDDGLAGEKGLCARYM